MKLSAIRRFLLIGIIPILGSCMSPDLVSVQSRLRVIAETVRPSVVTVTVTQTLEQELPEGIDPFLDLFFDDPTTDGLSVPSSGLGSGVIVRRDGQRYYVLTNEHVVSGAELVAIILDDGRTTVGRVVGADMLQDIALLSFESDDEIPVAVLGDSDDIRVGDFVMAIGSPLGYRGTVTTGIVSALGRRGGPEDSISEFIQTDAAINQGNSGGALINARGEVVGINTWISSGNGGSIGLNFSIPINSVVHAIDDFIETGAVRYGWLGVNIFTPTRAMMDALNVTVDEGALVHNLYIRAPASNAGIRVGDLIVSLNDTPIGDADELIRVASFLRPDESVPIEFIRRRELRRIDVTPGVREDEQSLRERTLWPGMSVFPVNERFARAVGVDVEGVVVISVAEDSAAASAGMSIGDIVLSIEGRSVETIHDFYALLSHSDSTTLGVFRDGELQDIQLVIPREAS